MAPVREVLDAPDLITALADHDIRHLLSVEVARPLSLDPAELIIGLAQHPEPRLREALIPLFLRHPEYAPAMLSAMDQLSSPAALTLRHFYTAAAYLQRLWQGTLGLYLGSFRALPDYFGQSEFDLPAPEKHFGEAGLRQLARFFEEKTGDNWLSTYESVMELFLTQLALEANGYE
jgi:hypothetical protein